MNRTIKVLLWLWTVFFITGCVSSSSSIETPSQYTETSPSTISPSQTIRPTKEPTGTATQTPTTTETLTTTPHPTRFITPTPLSKDEAEAIYLNLLANNGECKMPCVWGITPGLTTFDEARQILFPLASISPPEITYLDHGPIGGISPVFQEGDLELYTDLLFDINSSTQIIKSISFEPETHKIIPDGYEEYFESDFFSKYASAYTLPNILLKQGVPQDARIFTFATKPTRGTQSGFYLRLFYPNEGIYVEYKTKWEKDGVNISGCFANALASFDLYPANKPDDFFKFIFSYNKSVEKMFNSTETPWMTLEESISMTLEEFTELYSQPTGDACMTTPANLWPIPER